MRRVAVNEQGHRIGADHPRSTVPEWAIELILELHGDGLSCGQIAAKFDDPVGDGFTVSKTHVWRVCNGLLRGQLPARLKSVKG